MGAIASSGEEAICLLHSVQPDLVLMDIRLGGRLDGIDTALRIRLHHQLPVIFLTSHADPETLERAKYAEPSGYLVKPFRQINLCSAIEMAIFKHKSEVALRSREAWLSSILNSTADPTVVIDMLGLVQFLNPSAERMFQCDFAHAVHQEWTSVIPLFDQNQLPWEGALLRKFLGSTGVKLPNGLVLRRPDTTEVFIEGEISPSFAAGALTGFIITIRDISVRLEQEAQLRRDQKMLALGRLAGGLAHEFNKVLTMINEHISLLPGEVEHRDPQHRTEKVLETINTAADLTKQLLAMSGSLIVEKSLINVNDRIRRLIELLGPTLGPSVSCLMHLDPATGRTRMNPSQFDQVAMHLVINARDAMPNGGSIHISTSNLDLAASAENEANIQRLVRIVVSDCGTGIPPEITERLFEPFVTTKTKGTGIGLGLSVVFGIVQEVGGHIAVESRRGAGSSFSVLLPMVDVSSTNPITPGDIAIPSCEAAKTILPAEEEEIVRGSLPSYLQERGSQIVVAESGKYAFNVADQYQGLIDHRLSDARMPKMDDVTRARKITNADPNVTIHLLPPYSGDLLTESSNKLGRHAEDTETFYVS